MFSYDIVSFSRGEELMTEFRRTACQPDLVFLDIYMDGKNGIDTARLLRDMGYTGGIIFTTSSTEHVMNSYEINALYYLQKPCDYRHFISPWNAAAIFFEEYSRILLIQ